MNGLEPLDPDENLIGLMSARDVELFTLRRARADEHRVGTRQLFKQCDLVPKRHQVVCHRQRRRTCADQRDRLAVFDRGRFGQEMADVVFVVGRDALQTANRHGLTVDTRPPACRLAWAITRPSENPREHVRVPIDHVRVGKPTVCDQPNVFRDVRVGRARPLAVHHTVVVVRIVGVSTSHLAVSDVQRPRYVSGR
jgi:hypothetical protein